MKEHSLIGYEILGEHNDASLGAASIMALQHHERWNGTGYPKGIKKDEISLYARIVAVADVFDALTCKRPYKEPWPIEKAVDLIKEERGKHFDPQVVDAFMDVLDEIVTIRNELSD